MKNILYQLAIVILAIFIITSCNSDDDRGRAGQDKTEVTIDGGIQTKAVDTEWEDGDAIGVTMYDPNYTAVIQDMFNYKYVTELPLGFFYAASPDQLLYFPQDGSEMRLKAYYPYDANLTTNMQLFWSVLDQTDLPEIDLMTAEHQSGFTKLNTRASLKFYHRLSKLIFILSTQDNGDFVSLEDCTLTIKGMMTGQTYNLFEDVFLDDSRGPSDITVLQRDNEDSGFRQAIVLPRSAGEGVVFEFTTSSGDVYTALMSQTLALEGGNQYTFYITLSENPVEVSAVIEPWNEVQPQFYEAFQVSQPAGDTKGVSVDDVMNVYIQDEAGSEFSLLTRFTYRGANEWEAENPVYWQDITQNPAIFRASIEVAPALNNTQLPDILIADDISVEHNRGANFTFNHATSKVVVRLSSDTFSPDDLEGAEIILPDYTTGGYEENGVFIDGTGTEDILVDRTDVQNGIALFQSQYIEPDDPILRLIINGREYNAYDNGFTFLPGVAYEMIVRVMKEGVSVSATVIDWEEEIIPLTAITVGVPESGGIGILNNENLYVYTGDDNNRVPLNIYTYNQATNTFIPATNDSYWESLPDPTNFYGYIRRAEPLNNTQLPDYLVSGRVPVSASNGVHFDLKHAAAKVQVVLRSSDNSFSAAELNQFEITLPGYRTGGTIVDGLFVVGSGNGNILVEPNADEDGNNIALIDPHLRTAGSVIVSLNNGRTYTATYPDDIDFESGYNTILNVDLTKTEVTISASVVDWEDNGTVELTPIAFTAGIADVTDDFFRDKIISINKIDGSAVTTYDYLFEQAGNTYVWNGEPIYWDDQPLETMSLTAVYTPEGQPNENVMRFPWIIRPNQNVAADSYYDNDDIYTSHIDITLADAADFEFTHAVSKVIVKLIKGIGFEESELAGAVVTLQGFQLNGILNMETGNIVPNNGVQPITPKTEAEALTYSALVIPQNRSFQETVLTVTLPGYNEVFTGQLSAPLAFNRGVITYIEVTLNKTSVDISATLKDWVDGQTGSVTIQ